MKKEKLVSKSFTIFTIIYGVLLTIPALLVNSPVIFKVISVVSTVWLFSILSSYLLKESFDGYENFMNKIFKRGGEK